MYKNFLASSCISLLMSLCGLWFFGVVCLLLDCLFVACLFGLGFFLLVFFFFFNKADTNSLIKKNQGTPWKYGVCLPTALRCQPVLAGLWEAPGLLLPTNQQPPPKTGTQLPSSVAPVQSQTGGNPDWICCCGNDLIHKQGY